MHKVASGKGDLGFEISGILVTFKTPTSSGPPLPSGGLWLQLARRPGLQQLLDISLDILGQEVPGVALDWVAVRTNEELLKVPGDVGPLDRLPDEELWVGH